MRKFVTVAVSTVLAMTLVTGTASADVKGPYKYKKTCLEVRKDYAEKYKVGPCYPTKKGWYFKFS